MLDRLSPLMRLREGLADGSATPFTVAAEVIARANRNASRNTYLWFEPDEVLRQARELARDPLGAHALAPDPRSPLWSVPISLKDCFDLAGARTTCGVSFYAERPTAVRDSAMAQRLHEAGALITGKTHLHPLAYGITGQNPAYGDCLQPRDATLLTGGSSSGAAASVQEGSALAAIGTDTGGSIRVPAALCGLVGFRASHSVAGEDGWAGAAHLAPSFDTLGFLLRDPRDAAPIAQALFGIPSGEVQAAPRIGYVAEAFLDDCEPAVVIALEAWKKHLVHAGATLEEFAPEGWQETTEIFAGIQAHEAAAIHAGHYDECEPAIRERLLWGASLTRETVESRRIRLDQFRATMGGLLSRFDLLLLPCAPVSRLPAAADLSSARRRILRYTTPFSLDGLPVVSLPGEMLGAGTGTGVQIAARGGGDAFLLAFTKAIGASLAKNAGAA